MTAACVSATHVLLLPTSPAFFQEKTPSLRGVRQHPTGNNISPHGQRLASYIHASEFGVHRFPSARKPNAAVLHAVILPLKPNRPNPKSYLPAPLQTTLLSQGGVSATIVLAAIDKLFFYIQKMSGGLLPDQCSMTKASDRPRGTFTSFCT